MTYYVLNRVQFILCRKVRMLIFAYLLNRDRNLRIIYFWCKNLVSINIIMWWLYCSIRTYTVLGCQKEKYLIHVPQFFEKKSFLVDQITMIWYVDSRTCDSFQRTCWLVPFCLTNELIDEKISPHFDEVTTYHPRIHAL